MTNDKFLRLHLEIKMQYRNHLSICYSASLTPQINCILTLGKPFSFVWYVIPLLKTGAFASTCNLFLLVDDEKTKKKLCMCDWLQLSAAILAQLRRPVASTKALDPFHQAMCMVLYWLTTTAIKMARKVGPFFCHCFVCCCPGGCWGDTEWVVTQWQLCHRAIILHTVQEYFWCARWRSDARHVMELDI